MSRYQKPRGDQGRMTILERMRTKALQDEGEGITHLQPNRVAQITALLPQLTTAVSTFYAHDSARMKAVAAANTALEMLSQKSRAIWRAVKERTRSGGLPLAVRLYYGLPANGKQPAARGMNEWLTLAENIVQGEAQAVAAGYPALLEPTVADLQIALTAARTAVSQREAAKSAYETAANTLSDLRLTADELIADVMSDLRYVLRKETAAHRRDIMRSYGARFSEKAEDTSNEESAAAGGTGPEELAAPAAMSLLEPYGVPAVNGNGTAVHV